MKRRNKNTFKLLAVFVLPTLLLLSCKKNDDFLFDGGFTGVYFQTDSINYSFGVTPLSVTTDTLKVPVEIMGAPAAQDRIFTAEIIDSATTAQAGVQYKIGGGMVLPKDSIHGYIPLIIYRNSLGDSNYVVSFKLVAKDGFTPVNQPYNKIKVVFNNRVEPPKWKDWQGNPTWPDYILGAWNPLTYIKFIELFRAIEQKAPETYQAMVDQFGPDLENVTYGWPYDYDNTMTKYVTIPLYQYFMEQHPELGVVIPRPTGY